ncbi:MAG: hypothetical protein CL946_03170 [Ectothiorhodospiraceae bacterium]|nr:hypothetical protein [Ectothiorhodospiraceae bacterium]
MIDGNVPQRLTPSHFALLRWLLPEDRPGYDHYYSRISEFSILGHGRWGDNDFILGNPGDQIDVSGPMERVIASGEVLYESGKHILTVHEEAFDQIEVQFASIGEIPAQPEEQYNNRYCYSYWRPGDLAPMTETDVREVEISPRHVLAIAPGDEKLWLHEAASGMNHLIPHMKFHNELMRETGTRDKDAVFDVKRIFHSSDIFHDNQIRAAFYTYNTAWKKVELPDPDPATHPEKKGILGRLFGGKRS